MKESRYRIAAWNLAHQTRVTELSGDVLRAIGDFAADVVVFTEIVQSDGGESAAAQLRKLGFASVHMTQRVPGQNQVLIAARAGTQRGDLSAPAITPATQPNFLHVEIPEFGLEVVGVRVPMFNGYPGAQEAYWSWLRLAAQGWVTRRMIVIGDLNADPRKEHTIGGAQLSQLRTHGWQISDPVEPWSYVGGSRLDHALVSPSLSLHAAAFITDNNGLLLAAKVKPRLSDHAALLVTIS